MQNLKEAVQSLVTGEVDDSPATRLIYSRDASIFQLEPELIVYPKTVDDLRKLVYFANHSKTKKISLTPRAAGTDMSGGVLTDSIILDMMRHFNRVGPVVGDSVTVQPGVYYRDFERATLRHGQIMPAYTASREICAIGGMVANCCGGEKTLSYGKIDRYVTGLKVVLADAEEHSLRPLSVSELKRKLELKNFEGELYRKMYRLLEKHYTKIQAARPHVSKNSAGYALWDIWDKKTFDLTKLLVGSQGTLGIITDIRFRLIKPKKHAHLLVINLHSLDQLAAVINRVLAHQPESFECYDDQTLRLALRFLPEIAQRLKIRSLTALIKEFIPEFKLLITGQMPKLTLLAEFTGDDDRVVQARAIAAQESLADLNLLTDVTEKQQESKKYWVIRRESFNLLRHHVKEKHTAPFIDDVSVAPENLPKFLPALQKVMADYDLQFTIAGHIGDGNFHIFPLMNMKDPKTRKIIPELSKRVFALVFKYQGSMSGEHNDGLVRTPYLEAMYGKEIVGLFREVKKIFDPENIFNPGKKVDINLAESLKHLVK